MSDRISKYMPERMSDGMSEFSCHANTSRWYVRNYVRIVFQGGDHSKKVYNLSPSIIFPQTAWPHWGILTVGVKDMCSFKVVSGAYGKFGDLCIADVPSSPVFDGSLARNHDPRSSLPKGSFCKRAVLIFWAVAWQAWFFWDILRSETSFCMRGAGHRTLFHPRGWCGTLCTLLKRWQAKVKMRGAFGSKFGMAGTKSKIAFCDTVVDRWLGTWWWVRVFLARAVLRRPRQKSGCGFLTLAKFIFRGARNGMWKSISSPRCVCVRSLSSWRVVNFDGRSLSLWRILILRLLVQPSRHFGPVRSLSLWHDAHCEMARAALSSLCQIALVVAQCSFWGVRSLSLWCGDHLMVKELLCRDLGKEVSYIESLRRDLVQKTFLEILYIDLAKRSLTEILPKELSQSLYRDPFKSLSERPLTITHVWFEVVEIRISSNYVSYYEVTCLYFCNVFWDWNNDTRKWFEVCKFYLFSIYEKGPFSSSSWARPNHFTIKKHEHTN